jgi:hypothetical protein
VNNFAHTYTNKDGHLIRIAGYEGGYSPSYFSVNTATSYTYSINQLRAAAKLNTSTPLQTKGLEGWVGLNNLTAKNSNVEFPPLFQFSAITPSQQDWGALEDLYQPAPTPYWNGYANCATAGNC